MKIRFHRASSLSLALFSVLTSLILIAIPQTAAAATPTSTKLTVTKGANRVITLTATVNSPGAPVTIGQVNFCDASSNYCTDIHLLGTAQLTSAGTAVMKFVPGIGKHTYKAIFAGRTKIPAYLGSSSGVVPLTVHGTSPTVTSIAASGSVGDYNLTATVTGAVNSPSLAGPSGQVSFLDTSNNNSDLGAALLGTSTLGMGFVKFGSPKTNPFPQSVAVADFNGDGLLDMAVPVYSIFTSLPDVDIFLGNGAGKFTAGPTFPVIGQNVNNVAVGDFNGDGKADIAISLPDAGEIQVLLGNGDGTFTALTPIAVPDVFKVYTGEFNGDGKADLVVAGYEVTVLFGNGDGTFSVEPSLSIPGGGYALAVADLNGDGIADLAVANNSGSSSGPSSVTILLGKGNGTFTQLSESPATGLEPLAIAAGDFNGDGIPDLAVSNQNDGFPNPGTVTVLLGNGDGTFTPTAVSPQTGSIPYTVAIADFNGDGKASLVTSNAGSNTASVLMGNGDGTFAAALSPPAGTNPVGVGVGDFNGDGLPDVAAANNTPNTVTVLLTSQTQTATATLDGVSLQGSGQHLVDAEYGGNASYRGSTSGIVSLTGSAAARK